jgi:hypothetical protein
VWAPVGRDRRMPPAIWRMLYVFTKNAGSSESWQETGADDITLRRATLPRVRSPKARPTCACSRRRPIRSWAAAAEAPTLGRSGHNPWIFGEGVDWARCL